MSKWTEYFNNRNVLGDGHTFSGTMELVEITGGEESIEEVSDGGGELNYDPCSDTNFLNDKGIEHSLSTDTIKMSYGGGEGKFTIGGIGDEEILYIEEGDNILLRPLPYAKELINEDGEKYFLLNSVGEEWEEEYVFDSPLAKYASGISDGKIYIFGGILDVYNAVGQDTFYEYDVRTRTLKTLPNGGISGRSDAYGYCYNGNFYMYGGYGYSLDTSTFKSEFWVYNISSETWNSLSIPMNNPTNKIIGGHGKIYISNAMGAEDNGWTPLHRTYEYDISGGSWSSPYDGSDYTPEGWYNFEAFVYHQGTIYYFNEGKLMQILPSQFETTVGVTLPTLNYNSKMVSYKQNIIFSQGVTDGGTAVIYETKWFNTVTRMFGTFEISCTPPQVVYGFDIHMDGDDLYMLGGIMEDGTISNKIYKINLKRYFDYLDECISGVVRIPPDTYREKVLTMCYEYAGHPCPRTE